MDISEIDSRSEALNYGCKNCTAMYLPLVKYSVVFMVIIIHNHLHLSETS